MSDNISVLNEICARKRKHVEEKKNQTSLEDLKSIINQQQKPRGFIKALQSSSKPAIIAEVKKASPSKGIIRPDFDPVKIAKTYEANGAACISVLTDEPYFQGCDEYLKDIKENTAIPLLRKDFMVDTYQIYESRALGADCILLIMAELSTKTASELYDLSKDLGMDVLVEVHDLEELERAKTLAPQMVGINNRNLKTLKVDVQTSFDLLSSMPDCLKVAESGISDPDTIHNLQNSGFDAFLIGESLMRQNDIAQALRGLMRTKVQNI